jgi:hypothetical protein
MAARERLWVSLDRMLATPQDRTAMLDAMESKLFGIGVEAITVGSREFYFGYAASRNVALCLDMGHFHPTESVADKLSSVALSIQGLLLHISRSMRWDSDHVILLGDNILAMAQDLVFAGLLTRTRIGLDYFDATISRTAAWVIGVRNMQKALLRAFPLPQAHLKASEARLDFTARLILSEEAKDLPFSAVWGEFCAQRRPAGAGADHDAQGLSPPRRRAASFIATTSRRTVQQGAQGMRRTRRPAGSPALAGKRRSPQRCVILSRTWPRGAPIVLARVRGSRSCGSALNAFCLARSSVAVSLDGSATKTQVAIWQSPDSCASSCGSRLTKVEPRC